MDNETAHPPIILQAYQAVEVLARFLHYIIADHVEVDRDGGMTVYHGERKYYYSSEYIRKIAIVNSEWPFPGIEIPQKEEGQMKVKDVVLMLSCMNQELDVRIQDQEGAPVLVLEDPETRQAAMIIHPVSGAYETANMMGMMIGMAFAARDQEELCAQCTPHEGAEARGYCSLHKKRVGGPPTSCIEFVPGEEGVKCSSR